MSVIKDSTEIDISYENISAVCPFCGHKNTFNRRSDLGDTEPIDRREVNCGRCGQRFGITGDTVNPLYEMLSAGIALRFSGIICAAVIVPSANARRTRRNLSFDIYIRL